MTKESKEMTKESKEMTKETKEITKDSREIIKDSREIIKGGREIKKASRETKKESNEPIGVIKDYTSLQIVRNTQTEFNDLYTSSQSIVNTGARKLALQCKVTNARTGQGLTGTTLVFEPGK